MSAVASKGRAKKIDAVSAAVQVREVEHPTVVVGKTLARLVSRIRDAYERADLPSEELCIHGGTLIDIATEYLESVSSKPSTDDHRFYRIAACLTGALSHDRENTPTATDRHRLLEEACNLIESAVVSFGFSEEPCVAVANGIKAGQAAAAGSMKIDVQISTPPIETTEQSGGSKAFDTDAASLILQRAASVSSLLMNIFGRGTAASPKEMRELTGLMGSVQHLRTILGQLETAASEFDGDMPRGSLGAIIEASHLATLFDEIEWLDGYAFNRNDDQISFYFDAIRIACEVAIEALEASVSS